MDGLTIGRNVHYVESPEHHLAALVAYIWDKERGLINLGGFDSNGQPFAKTSVLYDEGGAVGTWHWIEKA